MAGLIPQSFIQDLLARTDIVQVIGERLQLKKQGREYVALSPFTNEKSPSFTVSPTKQFYHCFSSGKHGTAITFLMEYDRLPFVEAVEELARRAGLEVPREGGLVRAAPKLDGPLAALTLAEKFFKAELRKSEFAIAYLKKRGLSGETAKRFGIGFAPDSWDALNRQFEGSTKHALDAGLLIQRDGGGTYDRFRNRVMFPIRDTRGRVIGFGGRTLGDDKAKYLNSPETELFHKGRNLYGLFEARQGTGQIPHLLVVEGYMDAVMLAQHGITHVVATLGTATTREHLTLLFKTTQRVVFCFDGDRAGRAAAWRGLEQALPEAYEGRECRFMFLPDGHDPDTLVQEIGAEEFNRRVAGALSLSDFLLQELSSQVNLATPDGRARLAVIARPYLSRLREGPLRSLILDELSRRTRLTRADLESVRTAAPAALQSEGAAGPAIAEPVRRALQLLLENPALHEHVTNLELLAQSDAAGVGLLVAVLDFLREEPGTSAGQLLERWRGSEEGAVLDRLSVAPLELKEGAFESGFSEQINKLQERAIHRGLRERHQAIARISKDRPLSADELAEMDALNEKLRKSV